MFYPVKLFNIRGQMALTTVVLYEVDSTSPIILHLWSVKTSCFILKKEF